MWCWGRGGEGGAGAGVVMGCRGAETGGVEEGVQGRVVWCGGR